LLAILNAWLLIIPRRDLGSNDEYQLAMQVRQKTLAADLIVTDSDDLAALYLVYFGERTVLPAAESMTESDEPNGAFADLLGETRANGGHVYLLRGKELVFLAP
jgi:hypothetical protein